MRTTWSSGETKIFPSPTFPVRAACTMASTAMSTRRLRDRGFHFYFGQEVDDVFGAAIQLRVAFLAAEAFDFGDGDAGDAGLREGLAYFVELEAADDGGDQFHVRTPSLA